MTDRDAQEMEAEITCGETMDDAALAGEDPGAGADESGLASGSLETEEGSPT